MSFTLNDIALLLVALAIGLILGLMMSGRGKYRRAWRDEQAAHRAMVKDRDAQLDAANARIVDLEKRTVPVGAAPVAATVAERDDLSRIKGLSQAQEVSLNEAGYQRYGQIAALNGEQEATLEARLGLTPGTIARENWREQARALEGGGQRKGLFGRSATPV
jgi:predicted flap endonuclease-1-like 5' DNA nuclease